MSSVVRVALGSVADDSVGLDFPVDCVSLNDLVDVGCMCVPVAKGTQADRVGLPVAPADNPADGPFEPVDSLPVAPTDR